MTTAYTSLLGLALPVTGELSGTWGDTVNTAITSLLDTAIAGTTSITTDADITLTTTTGASNQARQAIILWNPASGTTTRYITAPAQSKLYTVINASGGTQSIVIRGVGPTTGVTIAKGESAMVAWNGSDFVKVSSSGGALTLTDLTVTGNTILGDAAADTLTVNATSTFAAPVNFQGLVKLPSTGRSAAAALTVTAPAFLYGVASTYTDTTSSGTVGAMAPFYSIAQPTLSTSNVTTYTNAATLYIANAPATAGSATITNPYALYIAAGANYFGGASTFNSTVTANGNVTLGDAAADNITVNGTITSNLIFTDNTYDIGASGATRPRNLYLAGNSTIGGNETVSGTLTVLSADPLLKLQGTASSGTHSSTIQFINQPGTVQQQIKGYTITGVGLLLSDYSNYGISMNVSGTSGTDTEVARFVTTGLQLPGGNVINVGGTGGGNSINLWAASGAGGIRLANTTSGNSGYITNIGDVITYNSNSSGHNLTIAGATALYINASGQNIMGGTTAYGKLTLTTAGDQEQLTLLATSNPAGSYNSAYIKHRFYYTGTSQTDGGYIQFSREQNTDGAYGACVNIGTRANGSGSQVTAQFGSNGTLYLVPNSSAVYFGGVYSSGSMSIYRDDTNKRLSFFSPYTTTNLGGFYFGADDGGGSPQYFTFASAGQGDIFRLYVANDGANANLRFGKVGTDWFTVADGGAAAFSNRVNINGSSSTATALNINGNIYLDTNACFLYGKDSGGTQRVLIGMNSSNVLQLGAYTLGFTFNVQDNNAMGINSGSQVYIGNPTVSSFATLTQGNSGVDIQVTNASTVSSLMNANATNNILALRAPFSLSPESGSNSGAKWGIWFSGGPPNDATSYPYGSTQARTTAIGKSAAVYGISDDNSAGYNRAVGLAFFTCTGNDTNMQKTLHIEGNSGNTRPGVDNGFSCGTSSYRWTAIYAVNGTIQTSDANTKTDVVESPLGLDFIKALRPVAYKFKVGKNTVVVHDDGTEEVVETPGKRQHFGLIAQEVKAATPANVDFGGWIQTDLADPNSEQGLRYDEFVAPIVKAIQEQQAMIEQLKSELAALKGA